ncbi:hypothetical protein A5886_000619 [Enterococcus sp. 8G7_MSG3316]|uniref:HTH cro/C1-type domain-containing protein n=1 Tax=Candidatus Enterococcus testudinis TaxID=1834191 RepID=A0A242A3D1_9ENTE|nr:helix-turn-helix transcriptional regulator [Enterococcus sp. 8G7_MSG3316]OTN75545.1 hypothetical protein A5886_000619 [Enterococcus sp. 8G7_MSG3316]
MFPHVIKELRLKNNFTQQEIAHQIGITRPAYTAYELGKREPDFRTLQALADLFGVTTDFLLGRTSQITYSSDYQRTLVDAAHDSSLDEDDLKEILSFIAYIKSKAIKKKTID